MSTSQPEEEHDQVSKATDKLRVLQDATSPKLLGEADWMAFDQDAAGSDKDAIESMYVGDSQMRANIPEPASNSLAQQYYELQSRLLEAQNKKRLEMVRQKYSVPAINSPLQEYQLQLQQLEVQEKLSSKITRQEQPEPGINLVQQDYELQLRVLEEQNERRLDMAHQEQPKLTTSLAQQDYELQLKMLEVQNKKRLEMARQEQSKFLSQPPPVRVTMKGPPQPNVMAIMGSVQGNVITGSGNAMATLPPEAPYFIPTPRYYPANPVAMNVNDVANSGAQPATLPMSPNSPDPPVLVLQRQLRVLQLTNQVLRRQLKDAKGINFAVFHCIIGQEGEGTYLEKPYWTRSGEKLQLKADSPVLYPNAYILYKPLSFIVYKYYSADIPTETREALQQAVNMPDPQPTDEVVKLVSDEMIKAMQVFERKDQEAQREMLCLSDEKEMQAPYLWWYYYRDNRNIISDLPKPEAELIQLLTNWIDANYSELYDQIDSQFKRGVVSAASLSFLIQPGDVLVCRDAEGVEACLAMSWLHKRKRDSEMQELPEDPDWTLLSVPWAKRSEWSWEVVAWSYVYNGDFYRLMRGLVINLDVDTADKEIPIVDLNVFPLRFASQELRETLERRGKTFWNCVTRKENALIREFKVDSRPKGRYKAPSGPDVYLFPRTIIGYHLQRKEWDHLNVDQIQEMPLDKNAFSNFVADAEIKELVHALITTKIAAEREINALQMKGSPLIMVLNGGPGTGKTFTVENIAELAEKRFFSVKCSKVDITAGYLQTMFYLARLRGCLLIFEDAEALLEQRSPDDITRNGLVSEFMSELERFDGIIVLTSQSANDLDELLKARSRLSLHYESLTQPRRAQIWRKFLSHLDSLGEKNIDIDGIVTHIDELSERVMTEHQIFPRENDDRRPLEICQ
ncbi:hypothetical protein GGI35DRAFT_469920 [Trichoderma velutinum]